MLSAPRSSEVMIFAGPNGAGKDTLQDLFVDKHYPTAQRHVRYITREPAQGEVEGESYHFIDENEFDAMEREGLFIESARYPGVASGTGYNDLTSQLEQAERVCLSANLEDGLLIARRLRIRKLGSKCLFISPCAEDIMRDDPDEYVNLLATRMKQRGRASDHVGGRLLMARRYRDLYLFHKAGDEEIHYVDNSDGKQPEALRRIEEIAGVSMPSAGSKREET